MKYVYLILVGVIVVLLNGFFVSLLWNWVIVPTIPGVNELDYIHAIGLVILCNILFKNNKLKDVA